MRNILFSRKSRCLWYSGLLILIIMGLSGFCHAEFSTIPSDSFPTANRNVNSLEIKDNTLYVGGYFDRIGKITKSAEVYDIASEDIAGDLPKIEGYVNSVVPDGAGGWYVGGRFICIYSDQENLIHINPDHSFDSDFSPELVGTVKKMVISLDYSTLYVIGIIDSIGGAEKEYIAAFNSVTGELKDWYDPAMPVKDLAVSPDGTTVYVLEMLYSSGSSVKVLAVDACSPYVKPWALESNSTVTDQYYRIILSPDGSKIYFYAKFLYGSNYRYGIISYDAATGSLLAPRLPMSGHMEDIAISPDGSIIYIGGDFSDISGYPRNNVGAIKSDSFQVTGWNPNADKDVYQIVPSNDGDLVYVRGSFDSIGGSYCNDFAALDADTGISQDLPINFDEKIQTISLSSDNELFFGGYCGVLKGAERKGLAAIDLETGQLTAFHANDTGLYNVRNISVNQIEDKVFINGNFSDESPNEIYDVAALDADTGVINWGIIGPSGCETYCYEVCDYDHLSGHFCNWFCDDKCQSIADIAVTNDEMQLFIGGYFWNMGNGLAVFDIDSGTLWDTLFDINTVSCLKLINNDSFLLAGGSFDGGLFMLDTVALEFIDSLPYVDDTVNDIEITEDESRVFFCGGFNEVNGIARKGLASLDLETGELEEWNPFIRAEFIEISPDENTLYIVTGNPSSEVMAIDTTTGELKDWNLNLPFDISGAFTDIEISPDGSKLYLGLSWRVDSSDDGYLGNLLTYEDTQALPRFAGLLKGTPGDSELLLEWNAEECTYGPLTYKVFVSETSGVYDFGAPAAVTAEKSAVVDGLVNGRTYYFIVKAENSIGVVSEKSEEIKCVPSTNLLAADIYNCDFEYIASTRASVDGISGKPYGWTASNRDFGEKQVAFYIDDSDPYQGNYCALMEASGVPRDTDDITICALISDNIVQLEKNRTYQLSAMIRRNKSQWCRVTVFSAGYGLIFSRDIDAMDNGIGDSGWQLLKMYLKAPENIPVYVRFDSLVSNKRTAGGQACRMWIDDIQMIEIGEEAVSDIYNETPPGPQYGIRNRYFEKRTEAEISVIEMREYISTNMPIRWNISMAVDNYANDAPDYPQWGQEYVEAPNSYNSNFAYIRARAKDNTCPAWPALSPEGANINSNEYNGKRHALNFNYFAGAGSLPLLRVFMINTDFSSYSLLLVDSQVAIPSKRVWPLCLYHKPEYNENMIRIRFDNITMGPAGSGPHTDETTVYLDNVVLGVVDQ